MLPALISAIANAAELVIDKIILTRERVALHVFLPIVFLLLFLIDVAIFPLLGHVDWVVALLPNTLFLILLLVVVAISWNVLYYQHLQSEKLHQHELLQMMSPLVTILLAAVFFPEEFSWKVFILAVIAAMALIFARAEKKHLVWDTATYNMALAVVLMAIENIIVRELLFSYSPVALYAVRTFFVALFFMGYYRPRLRQVSKRHWRLISLSGLVGVTLMVGRFYAFDKLGITYTALLTILAPIIAFYASWGVLHERIRARVVVASLVIMVCVVMATVFQFS